MQLFDLLENLESRLVTVEKNSKNSSKPPSSDGLKKGAAEPRQVGEKPTGGQKGHQGVTREMVENPDVIEVLYPLADVCECGCTLDKNLRVSKNVVNKSKFPNRLPSQPNIEKWKCNANAVLFILVSFL
jgi:hypothetical protein